MNRRIRMAVGVLVLAAPLAARAQVTADESWTPPARTPLHPAGEGPRVLVDEAHANYHTVGGRFAPFAALLEADGFRVRAGRDPLGPTTLEGVDLLVIANARPAVGARPSALDEDEIEAVVQWVEHGGALLLVADHMPFPRATEALAARFGIEFSNGFAIDPSADAGWTVFSRADGTLGEHPVTEGVETRKIDAVASFVGQAFRIPEGATSLLDLPADHVILFPEVPWRLEASTPRRPAAGSSQGAVLEWGRGRVAVFGEAAMLTAQRTPGGARVGFGHPRATENARFVLSLVRWLTGAARGSTTR